MKEYLDILNYIIANGTVKENRTGVKTLSVFDYHYKVDVQKGFPLLTTKKINWKNILFENLWFLSGDSRIDFLHKHGIKFWDPWLEDGKWQTLNEKTQRMEPVKSLPEAYGEYWRHFPSDDYCYEGIDQFAWIINQLKTNPDNRRLCLTNWYPPSAHNAKLPPCHCFSVFNVQYTNDGTPELNLHMTQRSCDVPVGVPYNLAGYAFLLELVSHLTGIRPRYFGHNLVDAHIYSNQFEGVVEQIERKPTELPRLIISDKIKTLEDIDNLIKNGTTEDIISLFRIENYNPQPFIKFKVAV